ncbi:MAG: glycosyltransferase family 2 protein [Bacteroidota bacterium]
MISLITCSYNNRSTIQDTLSSAAAQSGDFEYLVIDGVSTDGSLDQIRASATVSRLISEKDKGLYDALNKGVANAGGDIIGFLHADDVFASAEVIRKVQQAFEVTGADAVYGDLNYVSSDLKNIVRKWKSGNPGNFVSGWMPPHPALFVKKEVFDRVGGFRLDLGSAADYEWMLRAIHINKIRLAYIPEVLVNMRVGGMSNADLNARKKAWHFDLMAWEVNGLGRNYAAVMLKKLRKLPQYILR